MPNHITTILTFEVGKEFADKIFEAIRGEDDRDIDFNKIIPQPKTFRDYDTTNHPNGEGLMVGYPTHPYDKDAPIVTEELIDAYRQATREQQELYGVIGWYDCNRRYWGTKWNAYDTQREGNTITFNTAWCFPRPVIEALSRMFPAIKISYVFADEDAGCNTGSGVLLGGEYLVNDEPENESPEAWANYLATHPWAENDLVTLGDGTYKWKED